MFKFTVVAIPGNFIHKFGKMRLTVFTFLYTLYAPWNKIGLFDVCVGGGISADSGQVHILY